MIDDRTWTVTDGVEATEIAYVSYEGYTTKMFVVEVDLSNPAISIAASLPDNGTTFKMQSMTRQALAADAAGNKVWAGFNADFFNMTTGVPRGPVHRNGVMLKNTFDSGERSVFYITRDKKAAVAHRDDYPAVNASGVIQEAVGGGVMLMTEGELVTQEEEGLEPRTAVGVSEDGKRFGSSSSTAGIGVIQRYALSGTGGSVSKASERTMQSTSMEEAHDIPRPHYAGIHRRPFQGLQLAL